MRAQSEVFDQIEATSGPDMTALSGIGEPERVGMVAVTAGFFALLGGTLGRFPTEEDRWALRPVVLSYEFWKRHFAGEPQVLGKSLFIDNSSCMGVIINEALAQRFWPNKDPIGQVITKNTAPDEQRPREIIGIVGNVRQFQLGAPPGPEMYILYSQQPRHCTAPEGIAASPKPGRAVQFRLEGHVRQPAECGPGTG